MDDNLPCINCITLAICRSQIFSLLNKYPIIDRNGNIGSSVEYVMAISQRCSVIDQYIVSVTYEDEGFLSIYADPELCDEVFNYLSKKE